MVVVDADTKLIEGDLGPSSDTASHAYVYRHRPDVMGVVHTHSNYATAFAAVGRSIPVVLTAIADEFGCEIPCAPYARIGGQEIGKTIVEHIGPSLAVLMRQHGVFTIGPSVEKALKAAVMVEDIAKTVWLALQIGEIEELPAEEIAANYERYSTRYGTMDASRKRVSVGRGGGAPHRDDARSPGAWGAGLSRHPPAPNSSPRHASRIPVSCTRSSTV